MQWISWCSEMGTDPASHMPRGRLVALLWTQQQTGTESGLCIMHSSRMANPTFLSSAAVHVWTLQGCSLSHDSAVESGSNTGLNMVLGQLVGKIARHPFNGQLRMRRHNYWLQLDSTETEDSGVKLNNVERYSSRTLLQATAPKPSLPRWFF